MRLFIPAVTLGWSSTERLTQK